MADSSPSRTTSATPASDQPLRQRAQVPELSRPAPAARWQSNRLHVQGFNRPRSSTVGSAIPGSAIPEDYVDARPISTAATTDAAADDPMNPHPGLLPRRRSNTWTLSNPLKRMSRVPAIDTNVQDPDRSDIPPSPDDIDPGYVRARNRYNQQVVDFLDAIDPEVSTMTNLADMQNSLFVPNLGAYLDRSRPFRLSRPPMDINKPLPGPPRTPPEGPPGVSRHPSDAESVVRAGEYLVMPSGWVDWGVLTDQERHELDEYVHYLLTSKRERLRRSWRGFKQYVRTPLGCFVVVYASLLTFWGAAWVLFLIGWLSAGPRQAYFVEICDQILTALFCTVGIGLAPFRAVDTYHMIYIARLHLKSLRLRRERHLAPLPDKNDLPADETTKCREHVLSDYEQLLLEYHQKKFSSNHTFYRPHETDTHGAFPLSLLIAVVCILDCHSIFQIALGTATWSISYHKNYKKILTAVILSISISCNITGGILIALGNRRTRKKEVLEQRLHSALSEEAIRRREKARRKQIMHETIEEKEARLKAEKEAEPGLLDRVRDKLQEEGGSSEFFERITTRLSESESRHGHGHGHHSRSNSSSHIQRRHSESDKPTPPHSGQSTGVATPVTPTAPRNGRASFELGRSRKPAMDSPLRAHHETDEEHRH